MVPYCTTTSYNTTSVPFCHILPTCSLPCCAALCAHAPQCRTINIIIHMQSTFAMTLVILGGAKANKTPPTTPYYPIVNFAITISQAVTTSSERFGNNVLLGTSSLGSYRLAQGSTKRSVSGTTTNLLASTARGLRSELVSSTPLSSSHSSACGRSTLSTARAISTVVIATTSSVLAQLISGVDEAGIRDEEYSSQDAGVQENDAERARSVGISTNGGGGSGRSGYDSTLKLQELLEICLVHLSIHTQVKILSFWSSS